MKTGKKYTLTRIVPDRFDGRKWHTRTEVFDVTLMAFSGKYAMVRRPGCIPFVCFVKELSA